MTRLVLARDCVQPPLNIPFDQASNGGKYMQQDQLYASIQVKANACLFMDASPPSFLT